MSKLGDFAFEVEYGLQNFWNWVKRNRFKTHVMLNLVMVIILLIVLSKASALNSGDTIIYNIMGDPTKISFEEVIAEECKRQGVDEQLVNAIMYSGDPADGVERIGLMKLHPDLNKEEFINISHGVSRLKWCLDKNKSIDGALMVYIYTKPIAQEMWKEGIRTTMWVENVKKDYNANRR